MALKCKVSNGQTVTCKSGANSCFRRERQRSNTKHYVDGTETFMGCMKAKSKFCKRTKGDKGITLIDCVCGGDKCNDSKDCNC